jgi:PAS domain S-box-containing protein
MTAGKQPGALEDTRRPAAIQSNEDPKEMSHQDERPAMDPKTSSMMRDECPEKPVNQRWAAEEMQILSLVAQNTRAAISISDIQGRLAFINGAGSAMVGIPREEITKHSIYDVIPEAHMVFARDQIVPAIIINGIWEGDCQYKNLLTGKIVDAYTVALLIKDPESGNPLYLANLSLDTTEKKLAQEALAEYNVKLEKIVAERTERLTDSVERLRREIEERVKIEYALRARECEIEKSQRELEEMNAALKVLLKQRSVDKAEVETSVLANIKLSILPFLERLKITSLNENQLALLSEVEVRLKDITSPFVKELSSEYLGLSPNEIQVASLVKEGRSSKEIATFLNVSVYTVISYRYNIRRKTGLKGQKVNMRAYLQNLK